VAHTSSCWATPSSIPTSAPSSPQTIIHLSPHNPSNVGSPTRISEIEDGSSQNKKRTTLPGPPDFGNKLQGTSKLERSRRNQHPAITSS
ncbi:hypothetical protein N657DRAFT_714034, partial [Parathielavia appendiculata]